VRIPFPERVPIAYAAVFCAALFAVQWMEGTALYFSAACVAFILISTLAFNSGGGLSRAPGAFVFFYSTLVLIVGVTYKAYLGEPGQTNLTVPKTDMEVYVGGIIGMYMAVIISRRLSRRTGLLQNLMPDALMYRASVGCIAFGIAGSSVINLLGNSGLALQSAFDQLNQLIPLGIIIGVMYELRRSGGTRSVNAPILVGTSYYFVIFGILGFSKQGMLLPLVCILLPMCALRYRFSAAQLVGLLVGTFIIFHYLVPFVQYGRGFREEAPTLPERAVVAMALLEHPDRTRLKYDSYLPAPNYYNTSEGFWDRLNFIWVDDGINYVTEQGHVFGLLPVLYAYYNVIPHFVWKDKPGRNFSAAYTSEITGISEEELEGIGISFSPTAEAFHMAKWFGLFIVAPLVWLLLFLVFDTLFGDLRATPWGLLAMAIVSHTAPEGSLTGSVWLSTIGAEVLVFCALFATWVAPIFGDALVGPKRQRGRIDAPLRPRLNPRGSR
jgi:hypothetical protein